MRTLIGHRFQRFTEPGSMGVVQDTTFIRCFWPRLDRPTRLFADGSSGIRVMGPPAAKNVVFPDGTVFLERVPDAEYPAELAMQELAGWKRPVVNLPDHLAVQYLATHAATASRLPKTATKLPTREAFFLSEAVVNPIYADAREDIYVAELTKAEALDLVEGRVAEAELRAAKTFKRIDTETGEEKTLIRAGQLEGVR